MLGSEIEQDYTDILLSHPSNIYLWYLCNDFVPLCCVGNTSTYLVKSACLITSFAVYIALYLQLTTSHMHRSSHRYIERHSKIFWSFLIISTNVLDPHPFPVFDCAELCLDTDGHAADGDQTALETSVEYKLFTFVTNHDLQGHCWSSTQAMRNKRCRCPHRQR